MEELNQVQDNQAEGLFDDLVEDNEVFGDDETEEIEATEQTSEEADKQPVSQQPFLRIRYNKEDVDLTQDEAIALAQKGKNWEKLGTASTVFGYLMIAVVVAYSVYVFLKSKSPAKYYICSFILAFGMYMMAIKMHERYAFPGIIMLMFALIAVPTTKNFIMYGLFSLTQYFNMAWILFIYQDDINKYFRSPVVAAASVINILFSVFCIYTIQKETVHYKEPVKKNNTAKNGSAPVKKPQKLYRVVQSISTSKVFPKIVKADIIIIAAISVVYGVIALYNLGNTYAPQTETVI